MREPIEVVFENTEDEFTSAMRMYLAQKLKPKQAIVTSAVLLIVSVFLLALGRNAMLSFVVVAVAVAMLGIQGLALLYWPRRIFRREPSFRDKFRLRFSDEGICYVSDEGDVLFSWDAYEDVLESELVYVLISTETMFTAIPKGAFADVSEEVAFLEMAKERLAPL